MKDLIPGDEYVKALSQNVLKLKDDVHNLEMEILGIEQEFENNIAEKKAFISMKERIKATHETQLENQEAR